MGLKLDFKKVFTAIVTGAVICLIVLWWRGVFSSALGIEKVYQYLCDAFFVSGVLILGAGLMSVAKASGFFDAVGYSFEKARLSLTGKGGDSALARNLNDYSNMKKDEGKRSTKIHLIVVGLIFTAIAFLFQYLYYNQTL